MEGVRKGYEASGERMRWRNEHREGKKGHSKWKSKEIKGQDGGKVMRDNEKAIQVLNRTICLLFIYIF